LGERSQPVQAALAWVNCWPAPGQLRSYRAFEQYWQGARAAAGKLGYRLEEFVCNEQLTPQRLETILVARGILGILLPPHAAQPDWGNFNWKRFSIVRLGRGITEPGGHVVTADQVANTLLAVEKMRARGYRRIGFVGFKTTADTRWLFDAGFLRAQMGMPPKERVPILGLDKLNPRASQPALMRWLKKEKPDAVLTVFLGLPEMLAQCGCRVPDDIGLAALSVVDFPIDAGIDQNALEIGRASILTLNSLIHDQDRGIPENCRQILIPGTWVDGSMLPVRS
jgi:DNA-binding LacI/PurR family transcriptional regulator